MSKELTEQWRNGTLKAGDYWCEITESPYVERVYLPCCDDIVVEVLAPVPTYDQFSQMVKKVERLEQLLESETLAKQEGVEIVAELEDRLKEAEEVILLYFKNTQNATYQSLGMNDGYYKKAFMHTVAKEYLEKYGVEK